MADFKEFYTKINQSFNNADKTVDPDSYFRLIENFREFESNLREYIQSMTEEEINKIIQKLKMGKEITKEDLDFIKLWIVGDAEYYPKLENNFNDWISELKRIVEEINKINDYRPNFEIASHLRALLQDGIRLIPSIKFFLEQKQRVNNFNASVQELDREEKGLLVRLLESKLASREF